MLEFGDKALDTMAQRAIPSDHFVFSADYVKDHFFSDDRMLQVKQKAFEDFRISGTPLLEHLVACLELTGTERLLDLGCGNGRLLKELSAQLPLGQIVGLDIASGVLEACTNMLSSVQIPHRLVEGSADDLSVFEDEEFDRVMANYMIHYVPDLDRCFREVLRVLTDGGIFVINTNSVRSMVQMYDVHFDALREIGAPEYLFKASPKGRMSLDNGIELLEPYFPGVERRLRPDEFAFRSTDDFMEFYIIGHKHCCASSVYDSSLPDKFFELLETAVRRRVDEIVAQEGHFVVTQMTGGFVCRRPAR